MSNTIYIQKLQEIFKNQSPTIKEIKKLETDLYEWILIQYPEHENLSAKVHCIIDEEETGFCYCGKKKAFFRPHIGLAKTCSKKCSDNSKNRIDKIKKTRLKKYGSENYNNREKYKETCLKRYNINSTNKLEEIKIKKKQTKLEKYGNENYVNIEKNKKTKLEKYGNENYNNKNKIQKTNLEKYGVMIPSQKEYSEKTKEILFNEEKFNEFMKDKTVEIAKRDLKISHKTIQNYISNYNTKYLKSRSSFELEMEEFLKENKISFIQNDRKQIKPKELDFYLPDHNLAIECNGNYWHSLYPEGYHTNKYNLCKEKDIKLLHIWEILWNENRNEMKEFILENI